MYRFGQLRSPQLGDLIGKNPLALIPIGQLEEHGPHLPVNTDFVIAERLSEACAEQLQELPCLLLPGVWSGYSGKELTHWPGTIRVRTRVFADLIYDIVHSLVAMGFRKIATVNGHGHHPALLEIVAREVADAAGVYIACVDVAKMAAPAVARYRKSPPGGCIHGGEFETSLMLYLTDDVDMAVATAEDVFRYSSPNVPADGFAGSKKAFWSTWGIQRSKTGVYGDPTLATRETGEAIYRETLENLVGFLREYHAAEPADWSD
ncbi:MAG: creatininase family protein [Armatimonadetes bacterium]|nr:creatininase family protein [Armatimonadota bacterium]